MHLSLGAGERVFINGAVLRVDRKVGIELLNDAAFLLEGHVLQVEQATTPLRQLYFAAQTMLIEPAQAAPARELCAGLLEGILAATRDETIRSGLATFAKLIEGGRLFEALKTIRNLYPAEAAVLESQGALPDPAPARLKPGREVPPQAPRKPAGAARPRRTATTSLPEL